MPRKKQDTPPAVSTTNSTKTRKPRETASWREKPFALIVGKSLQVQGQFATMEELVAKVQDLTIGQRARAFVGRFKPIEIETKLNMPEL